MPTTASPTDSTVSLPLDLPLDPIPYDASMNYQYADASQADCYIKQDESVQPSLLFHDAYDAIYSMGATTYEQSTLWAPQPTPFRAIRLKGPDPFLGFPYESDDDKDIHGYN